MMQAALRDLVQESPVSDDSDGDLSIAELDQRLEQAVQENERSERLICDYLLAMVERRGFEKFGFADIYYYAEGRFGFSARKTRYLLRLAQQLRKLPRIKEALGEGSLGWTKASRIARVATTEDEAMWLDSALSLSVRELDRKLNEQRDAMGVKIRAWLTQEQAAVWESALEVCRRMSGEDLDVGRCLEYIAGEFLATYAYLGFRKEETDCCKEDRDGPSDEEAASVELKVCPEEEGLPSPITPSDYGKTWRAVLERDAYRCQYPDCGVRSELQVHHIIFRSHSGRKGRQRSNSPQNLVTLCVFHHRTIHAGTIGVKGQAPHELVWRRPVLMENAIGRHDNGPVDHRGDLVRETGPVYGSRHTAVLVWKTFSKSESVSKGNRRSGSETSCGGLANVFQSQNGVKPLTHFLNRHAGGFVSLRSMVDS